MDPLAFLTATAEDAAIMRAVVQRAVSDDAERRVAEAKGLATLIGREVGRAFGG